ncbi:hypothetical protein CLV63_105214 [Murinocardiopsis flavida]|uniref:Uncharacterized protein n=2 Tax=Murinocardiopsis flavida TaxID=645275 RepID=A0A2P8DMU3_9ACTN|nr:hypothetical protein CLV63_105214 [Murinocardiopsis flavida]
MQGRDVNTVKLWAGGIATAVVAGLVILVGTLLVRGALGIPVLAPEEAGYFGDASTGVYAAMAALAALLATGLLRLLLVAAPAPLNFFGWIVMLGTAVAAVTPFTLSAAFPSQVATAAINTVAGVAIVTLLTGVGASSVRRPPHAARRPVREDGTEPGSGYTHGGEDDRETYRAGHRDAFDEGTDDTLYGGRHRDIDDGTEATWHDRRQ